MTADQLKDIITAGLACEHITLEGDGRHVRLDHEARCPVLDGRPWLTVPVVQHDVALGLQDRVEKAVGDFRDLFQHQRSGKLARHLRQRPGMARRERRFVGTRTQTRGESAGDDRYHQHHGESHEILAVVDHEGEARRHEEEVEQPDTEKRRQQCRPQAEQDGDQQDCEQEKHHDVREIEMAEQGRRGHRGGCAGQRAQKIALPIAQRMRNDDAGFGRFFRMLHDKCR